MNKSADRQLKRVIDTLIQAIKCTLAWIITLLRNKPKENCFIVGSTYGQKCCDNAQAFYQYLLDKNEKVYLFQNSPDGENVLKRGSFRAYLSYFNAKAVFFSHSFSDVLPNLHRFGWFVNFLPSPTKVFIQHGIIGLKKIDKFIKNINPTIDYFVVSSQIEKDFVKSAGVNQKKLIITGLPRFDDLNKHHFKKEILFFLSVNGIDETIGKILAVINDSAIKKIIKDNGYTMRVAIHDMVGKKIGKLLPKEGDGIYFSYGNVSDYVRTAKILITDNSSIAWDFFYTNREVIFYKANDYMYIDIEKEKYNIAKNNNQLLNLLDKSIHQKNPKPNTDKYFHYRDRDHSKRLYQFANSVL